MCPSKDCTRSGDVTAITQRNQFSFIMKTHSQKVRVTVDLVVNEKSGLVGASKLRREKVNESELSLKYRENRHRQSIIRIYVLIDFPYHLFCGGKTINVS